jgi:hypothetical protein
MVRMATTLTAFERETTINWNERDDIATVDTRSAVVIQRLEKAGLQPFKVRESINTGELLGKVYKIPKKWCRLPKLPTKRHFTEAQINATKERFKKSRLGKQGVDNL